MIHFTADSVEMPTLPTGKIKAWITAVAAVYHKKVGEINYIFCNDARILEVNQAFLGHDYFTDIITFDYSCFPVISGDIFISLDTVKSNAQAFSQNEEEELRRILIHGVLHLTGQADKTPEAHAEMTRKENAALKMW